MSGTTGERPFSDILTSIRVIHSITIPSLFIAVVIYQYRFSDVLEHLVQMNTHRRPPRSSINF
jgi:hypothetical protein